MKLLKRESDKQHFSNIYKKEIERYREYLSMRKEYKELDTQLKNTKSKVEFGENILPERNKTRDSLKIEKFNSNKNIDDFNGKILNLKKNIEQNLSNNTKKKNREKDMDFSL